jgi:hypothetical protein
MAGEFVPQFVPWNSIAESLVAYGEQRLSYPEGLASPCLTCRTAPCCTHLRVQGFGTTSLMELDLTRYLLNFERIELGLAPDGQWSVYYTYPCRHLNRHDYTCSVHNTPEQPQVCVSYNPYNCWYKQVFSTSVSPLSLRVDRQRLDWLLANIVFDDNRMIVDMPSWEALTEAFSALPVLPPPLPSEPYGEEAVTREWRQLITLESIAGPEMGEAAPAGVASPESGAVAEPAAVEARSFASLTNPCGDCQAYCCTHLIFPQPTPQNTANLDFFRYCLGFPGVEVGLGDAGWSLVVQSRCRHLEGTRCGVYGQPDRPLVCQYYDAWTCTYRPSLGSPRPAGFVRVGFDEFDRLAEAFDFDADGKIIRQPGVDDIRARIEAAWRKSDQTA